mmetsp:Transcript_11632/g.32194  ORF Transcript_11632/g.32194 Transcript_11632/m.32194 type:complete len:175 (-) Transcript_11632:1339-1863(-)
MAPCVWMMARFMMVAGSMGCVMDKECTPRSRGTSTAVNGWMTCSMAQAPMFGVTADSIVAHMIRDIEAERASCAGPTERTTKALIQKTNEMVAERIPMPTAARILGPTKTTALMAPARSNLQMAPYCTAVLGSLVNKCLKRKKSLRGWRMGPLRETKMTQYILLGKLRQTSEEC